MRRKPRTSATGWSRCCAAGTRSTPLGPGSRPGVWPRRSRCPGSTEAGNGLPADDGVDPPPQRWLIYSVVSTGLRRGLRLLLERTNLLQRLQIDHVGDRAELALVPVGA